MYRLLHRTVSLILILLLLQGCTSTKYIYSKNDPARIPQKLTPKDKNKNINVFQADTLYAKGQLIEFTETELKLLKKEPSDTVVLSFSKIDKVSLEHKEVPLPFFILVIGLCYGLYSIDNLGIPTN